MKDAPNTQTNETMPSSQDQGYEAPRLTSFGDAVELTLGQPGVGDPEAFSGLVNWA